MNNYRVFLKDGTEEILKEVTSVELLNGTLTFWFEHLGTNYTYPVSRVKAFLVLS